MFDYLLKWHNYNNYYCFFYLLQKALTKYKIKRTPTQSLINSENIALDWFSYMSLFIEVLQV